VSKRLRKRAHHQRDGRFADVLRGALQRRVDLRRVLLEANAGGLVQRRDVLFDGVDLGVDLGMDLTRVG